MLDVATVFAAFTYGLSGSMHCVVMCGPLAMLSHGGLHGAGQRSLAYQASRFLGYLALGAVFGAIGRALDLALGVTVSTLLPYLLVTTLVAAAFDLDRRLRLRLPRLAPKLVPKNP